MRIGYLGAGVWGFSLANVLARKGYAVTLWSNQPDRITQLQQEGHHPALPDIPAAKTITYTTSLEEACRDADILVESVTSAGLRPVLTQLKDLSPNLPLILTSKGIEQNSGLILPDVAAEVLGKEHPIGVLSGPSFAADVMAGLPTSVVGSSADLPLRDQVCSLFSTPTFRIYPNSDVIGVSYGGALKNIIAIACGVADGLGLGASSRAALMTRGLHEMRKLAVMRGAKPDTLNGLSGMGDLCLTCSSPMSRNYRYGTYLAKGESPEHAKDHVSMVVEGAYTALSALQLSRELHVEMPITEIVYLIIYEKLAPHKAVEQLMKREIKEEHL